MRNVLIIKIGALGDVLRTTPILHKFKSDNVFWITAEQAKDLLNNNPYIKTLLTIESNLDLAYDNYYDLVLNMDEEESCLNLASELINRNKVKDFYGYFVSNGSVNYVGNDLAWFNMSLNSKLGGKEANKLKWQNTRSYEEHLFSILGFKFDGEKLVLNYESKTKKGLVGIQTSGKRSSKWPMKKWNNYDALREELIKAGYNVKFLEWKQRLSDHIKDIAECEFVICEDVSSLHVARALNKKIVAIFICTPPQEIYDYGDLVKVVSPKLNEYFYRRDFDPAAANTISLNMVMDAFKKIVQEK